MATKKVTNKSVKTAVMNVKFNGTDVLCGECNEVIGLLVDGENAEAEAKKRGMVAVPVPAEVILAAQVVAPTGGSSSGKSIAARIAEARQSGKDVGEFYALTNGDGEGMVYRMVDGVSTAVQDTDPVLMKILGGIEEYGHLSAPALRRRFVTGQMMSIMAGEKCGCRHDPQNITGYINKQGFEKAFEIAKNELNYLAHCAKNGDLESLQERSLWWTKDVFIGMAEHFLETLKKYIKNLKVRHCKGVEYRRFHNVYIFRSDLRDKIYWPLQKRINQMKNAKSWQELYILWSNAGSKSKRSKRSDWRVVDIKGENLFCTLPRETSIFKGYKEAFKGAGAYYTMANLLLFQKSNDFRMYKNGKKLSKALSEAYLNELNTLHAANGTGYKMFAVLKEFMAYNNIDIEALREDWEAEKK